MLVDWWGTYDTKIVQYITGTDVLIGDPLGKMEITEQVIIIFMKLDTLDRMCVYIYAYMHLQYIPQVCIGSVRHHEF